MIYYTDDGDVVIDIDDSEDYRNARVVQDHRSRPRPRDLPPARTTSRRVVVRSPERTNVVVPSRRATTSEPVVVEQPVIERPPEYGVNLGGLQLSFGTVAGTVLTLGGMGLRIAAHFVDMPKPPAGDEKDLPKELVKYTQEQSDAIRKSRVMETVGQTLSDLGQLAAYKA